VQGFRGEFDFRFDDRNRVAIPAKYRSQFADGVILAPSVDGCVEVHTPESFQERFASLFASSPDDDIGRELRRFIHGSSWEVQLDGQGRILVPNHLREHGSLEEDLRLVGCGEYFELWNRPAYVERKARTQEQFQGMMQRLREAAR